VLAPSAAEAAKKKTRNLRGTIDMAMIGPNGQTGSKVTGGTGRYKGARGSGTFDAVLPADSTIFEVTVEGKIRY
jgi:hypothetical protein